LNVADQQELDDLLNREGKYASGWLQAHGDYVNLAAIVKLRPTGL